MSHVFFAGKQSIIKAFNKSKGLVVINTFFNNKKYKYIYFLTPPIFVFLITIVIIFLWPKSNTIKFNQNLFDTEYKYTANINNNFKVSVGEKNNIASILLTDGNKQIKFTPIDSSNKAVKADPEQINDTTTIYKNVLNGLYSIKHKVTTNGVKEEIIIENKESLNKLNNYAFKYQIDLKGLQIVKDKNGNYYTQFKDPKSNAIYQIPEFFMYDSKGEENRDISINIEEKSPSQFVLTMIPSYEWLMDESREFPIFIDPTIVKGDAPISLWKIEYNDTSSVYDFSSNSNNLSITNAQLKVDETATTSQPGSTYLRFDGNGDYLSRAYDSDYDFGTGSFSVSLWAKFPVKATEDTYVLLSRFSGAGYKIYTSSGQLCFGIDGDSSWTPTDSACGVPYGSDTIIDAKWHHIEAVKNGITSITLYIDGKQIAQDSSITSSSLSGITPTLYIGVDNGGSNYAYYGDLDMITIYNYARSEEQVRSDSIFLPQVNSVIGGSSENIKSGLVGHWNMDESSGDINDSTLNATILTNNNSAAFASGKFGNAVEYESSSSQYHSIGVSGDIQYDTVGSGTSEQTTTISWSHNTTASGSNVIMIVGVGYANGGNVNSVTYNGDSLTHIRTDKNGSSKSTSLWYLVNPDIGNNTVSVTLASSSNFNAGGSITLTGVDLNDPLDAQNGATGSSTSASTSVTTITDNAWLVSVAAASGETTLSVGGGSQTQRWNQRVNSVPHAGGTFGPQTPAGAKTMSWTIANSGAWATSAVALKPAIVDPTEHLQLTGSLSISAWVNPESNTAATQYDIAGKWDGANESYLLSQYGDEVRMYIDSSPNYVTTSSANLATGTWYHVVGVYDSIHQNVKIYINGSEYETTIAGTIPNSIGTDTGSISIGAEDTSSTPANFYDGKIDEVRFYNTNLNPRQVKALYNYAPGPVGYWTMNDVQGTTVYNSGTAGSVINGTNIGSNLVSSQSGKFGKSLEYEWHGTTSIPADSSINLNANQPFTISYWVSDIDFSGSNQATVMKYTISSSYGHSYSSNDLDIYTDSDVSPEYTVTDYFNSNDNSNWVYVTQTYDGDVIRVYKNSVLVGTSATGISLTTDNNNLFFGSNNDDSYYFTGKLDEVKIYNYARSSSQIIEDMNGGHPIGGSPVGSALLHYKFDEGVDNTCSGGTNDVCNWGNGGSALDGAQSNMAVPATSTSGWTNNGKFGKAMVFDGSNDYVSLSGLNPGGIFTISAWIRPSAFSTDTMIFRHRKSFRDIYFYVNSTWKTVHLCFYDTTSTLQCNNGGQVLEAGAWYHVVGLYDGRYIKTYVNGIQDSNVYDTTTQKSVDWTSPLAQSIGANPYDNINYFSGSIDEVKIYSTALTAEQVQLEYNSGKSFVMGSLSSESSAGAGDQNSEARRFCVPGETSTCNPPAAWYKFDEGSGTSIYDTLGNGYSGTLNGSMTQSDWVSGKFGKALDLDGVNDWVDLSDGFSDFTSGITIDFWAYPKSAGYYARFIELGNGCLNSGTIMVARLGTSSTLIYQSRGTGNEISAPNAIEENVWQHFTITQEAGGNVTIYKNGVKLSTSGTASLPTNVTRVSNWIGESGCGHTFDAYYQGKIDDVKVYNYARTPAQVAWDYNRGAPIAHYTFDECTGTSIGNWAENANGDPAGNNGTLNLGASGTTSAGTCTTSGAWFNGASGKLNSSMSFDGIDDYVNLGTSESINFPSFTTYSVSLWFKDTNTGEYTGYTSKILDKTIVFHDWRLGVDSNGNIQWFTYEGSAGDTLIANDKDYRDSSWHHLVAIKSGTNGELYIDGALKASGSDIKTVNSSGALYIGYSASSDSLQQRNFGGQIDDVRIFNYALTNEQIKQIANGGAVNYQ